MIGNIKENLPAKNWYVEKACFARSGVCQRGQKCMLHAMLQGCMKYPMSKESKEIKNSHNTVDLRHLSLMSKELKVL